MLVSRSSAIHLVDAWSLALTGSSENPGAAWEFISWATPVPGWSHDQMPVIGHQAIRKQFELRTFECFEQNTLEGYVVFRLVKIVARRFARLSMW